jgi:PAS domain S-box-containing protein
VPLTLPECALILAPLGRDAAIAAAILREANIDSKTCSDLPSLVAGLTAGAGFAVVTEDALRNSDLRPLSTWLHQQPQWSDFPFVLLTLRGGGLERNPDAGRYLETLGNVAFLERPFHPTTLISLAHAALRGRRRQYDARARLNALHENEAQFRTLANSIPALCWMAESEGNVFWFNDRWYEFTGTRADQMEGWGWGSAVEPTVLPAVLERWKGSLASGEPFEMVFPLRSASGEFRSVLARAQPVRDAAGKIVRWFGTNTDITVQRQAEASLREMASELERRVKKRTRERDRTWRNTQDLLAVIDVTGRFQAVNPAWVALLGWTEGELVGGNLRDVVHAEDTRITAAALLMAKRDRRAAVKNRLRHSDGSYRWISWIAALEGDLLYASGRDITAEKASAAELQRAQEALRQAQKLEIIGQLTGSVAHDFNNLLTPITGALDIIRHRLAGTDSRTERLIDGALQSAHRAKILLQRLLVFARRQKLEKQPIDLAALLNGMRDLIVSSVGPEIEVGLALSADLSPAVADVNQLELALLNLCVNARDAMPSGGVLTIAAEPIVIEAGAASRLRPGSYVRLSVIDTGTGMDAETLERAVEPFFSTKEAGRGTGLGLSMVHALAAQLDGAFELTSAVGVGTRADLWLPIASIAVNRPAEHGAPPPVRRNASLSILLVEDEELVRAATVEMLRDLGHEVADVSGGAEALQMIAAARQFDLLITDFKMPGMNGAELARRLRDTSPDVPVLLITGYAGAEGPSGLPVLAKPFRQADLSEAIWHVLNQEQSDRLAARVLLERGGEPVP